MITPDMAANAENIELLRERLGLNDPFIVDLYKRQLEGEQQWKMELAQQGRGRNNGGAVPHKSRGV